MNRWRAVVIAAAVLLTACGEPSPVDPAAVVEVSGVVQHLDGGAVTGGEVVVMKEVGPDELAADAPLFFGTMGLVCLSPVDLDLCDEHGHRAGIARDGTYRVTLRGSDVQSGFGTTSTLWVSATGPASASGAQGPSTSRSFQVTATQVEVPALRLWDPQVDARVERGMLHVAWPAPPRRLQTRRQRALLTDATGGVVWTLRRATPRVDARVLEDFTASAAVEARSASAVYRSASQSVAGTRAPASRGGSCRAVATRRETVVYDPCPLTDGDIATIFDPALDPECPAAKECPHWDTRLVIDLGRVRDVSLIVVRAEEDRLVFETSEGGRRWQALPTLDMRADQALVRPPAGTRARYLRVGAEQWPLGSFREISVW